MGHLALRPRWVSLFRNPGAHALAIKVSTSRAKGLLKQPAKSLIWGAISKIGQIALSRGAPGLSRSNLNNYHSIFRSGPDFCAGCALAWPGLILARPPTSRTDECREPRTSIFSIDCDARVMPIGSRRLRAVGSPLLPSRASSAG